MNALPDAIEQRHRAYLAAIDRLRDLASPEAENETYDLTSTLREAVTLVGCLRRLAKGRSAKEIHEAFGAPGDFGYDTPIGDALSRLYRGDFEDALHERDADDIPSPGAGACSFLGCPSPCHDIAKLKKLTSALVAADVAIRECATLKERYMATMDPEAQLGWDAAGRRFERAIENAIQITKGFV